MFYNFKCSVCKNDIQAEYQFIGELVSCPICDSAQIVPDPPLLVDSIFSGYKIVEIYASNHLWTSYKAVGEIEHPGQEVLLRIPSSFYLKNDFNPELFFNAVLRTGSLNLEGFPALVDRSITPGRTFFIYEFNHKAKTVSGFASKQVPISSLDSIKIVRRIACALNKAWEKENLIHQNLKPSNVRVDEDGNITIYEFGLSQSLIGNSMLLNKGFNIWDYRYMSPEFIQEGIASDQRCDIYALGGIFYLLLTGHHPYGTKAPEEVPESPLPDPREFNYEVPSNYISIIEKLMAKDINERFQSWNEVIEYINITCPESIAAPEAAGSDVQHINIAALSTGRFEPAGQLVGQFDEPVRKTGKRTGKFKKEKFTDTIARINRNLIPGINRQWKTSIKSPDADSQAVKYFFVAAAVILITFALVMIMLYSYYGTKKTIRPMEQAQREVPTVIAPASIPDQKAVQPGPKPLQTNKTAPSQKRSTLKEISDFYDSNPAINLSEAYRRLDTLKSEAIRIEDVKLVQDINEKQHAMDLFKKEKVSAVIEKLKKETSQLVKDGNLLDACEKIESYTGEYADESANERRLLSASLKKSVSDEKSTLLKTDIESCMSSGNFEEAEKIANAFKGSTEDETFKRRQMLLNQVEDRKTKFTREVSPLYTEACENFLSGQPDAGIDKIKLFIANPETAPESKAYAKNLLENISAYKSISQVQSTLDEKLKQCDSAVKGDSSFLRTMLCLQEKSYEKAKDQIKRIKYHLGDSFMQVVLEREAETVFVSLLAKYELTFNPGKTEQFLLELTQKKIQPANAVALVNATSQYNEKYKATSFVNKHENIIEAVRKFCKRAGAEDTAVKAANSVTVTPDDPQGGTDLIQKSLSDKTNAMSIFLKQGTYQTNRLREFSMNQNGTKMTGEPGTVIKNNLSVTGKDIIVSGINFEGVVSCTDNSKNILFRNCMFKSDLTKIHNSSAVTFQNCLFKGLLVENSSTITLNHCTILASPNAPDKTAALWIKGDSDVEINNSIIYGEGYGIAFTHPDNLKNRKINNTLWYGDEALCVVINNNKIDDKEKIEADKKTKLSKYFKIRSNIHSPPQFVDDKKGIWRLVKGVAGTKKADDGKDCGMVFEE
ncbi:MAG TPA: hypothetical protein DCZ94_10480 [Lentisphaeria bacterium]|nr:MAG: hypothetical protein A2X48_06355 [Lentisphaerae bacterium GWF2_49_21]HBC87370.1 hypothetical protein [Lentisphaeria bacterium]